MSHFLRIQTQIKEKEMLTQALRDLHYEYQESEKNDLVVRGWSENRETAEVVVNTEAEYDIGFKRKEEVYEVVADWWGVEGNTQICQESFLQQVNQQYAYNIIRDQAREDYLLIEEENVLETGEREIILIEDTRL